MLALSGSVTTTGGSDNIEGVAGSSLAGPTITGGGSNIGGR